MHTRWGRLCDPDPVCLLGARLPTESSSGETGYRRKDTSSAEWGVLVAPNMTWSQGLRHWCCLGMGSPGRPLCEPTPLRVCRINSGGVRRSACPQDLVSGRLGSSMRSWHRLPTGTLSMDTRLIWKGGSLTDKWEGSGGEGCKDQSHQCTALGRQVGPEGRFLSGSEVLRRSLGGSRGLGPREDQVSVKGRGVRGERPG